MKTIMHVDMDAFFAAVELLRHPELKDKPLVIGGKGDPTQRGVVSTASYQARKYGIHLHGVAARLRQYHFQAGTVTVKVRFADFETHTRSLTLAKPTASLPAIDAAAHKCLDRLPLTKPMRLMGVRLSNLHRHTTHPAGTAP